VDDRLGQFAGVVVVSMPPGYFTRFFGEVDLGAHGLTSLVGLDGVVRTRASRAGAEQGQDVSASVVYRAVKEHRNGVIRDRSVIDGIDRLYAYRALQHHDLYVVTAMGMDDVYAEPDQRARVWLATALAVTAVIGVFTLNIVRRSRARSRLMAELSASQVRAEAANRLKSKFLASVSHELRTPLNGILGYAELVRDTSTDEEAREFGGVIHSSAQHLHQLVNTILDLAKIESGHLVIQPAPTALPALLSEVQHLHAVHARQRGTQLLLALDEACPADITTDRTRLLQVLTNIVNNAIKFTEDGTITLGARPERGGVLLGVTDTGVGIAPERLDQLFERFHAVSARWGMAGQGAGLGLPLAKELTERLGGRLALSSRPGQGTQVTIWLPLVAPATAESPVQPAAV
jgi:signal transduction histidine kinase